MKLALNPLAFKSHYKFFTNEATDEVESRLIRMKNDNLQYEHKPMEDINMLTQGVYGEVFIAADDKYDKKIENILASRGIKFEKTPLKTIRSEDNILSRIEQHPLDRNKDHYLLDVDVEKFDKLFQKSVQYIGKYGSGGIDTRYGDFIKYIDLGMPIYASTIVISEENDKPVVSFVDGRHRYSVMRDLGFERIPVSMDESSKLVAEKYGLLKD